MNAADASLAGCHEFNRRERYRRCGTPATVPRWLEPPGWIRSPGAFAITADAATLSAVARSLPYSIRSTCCRSGR